MTVRDVFGLVAFVAIASFYIWTLRWVYDDAVARGKDGMKIAWLIALFMWPMGLLLWLIARPDSKRQNALAMAGGAPRWKPCSKCGRMVERKWKTCPRCGTGA